MGNAFDKRPRRSERPSRTLNLIIAAALTVALILGVATLNPSSVSPASAQADDQVAAEASPPADSVKVADDPATDGADQSQPPTVDEQPSVPPDQNNDQTSDDQPPAPIADTTTAADVPTDQTANQEAESADAESAPPAVQPAPLPSLTYTPADHARCKPSGDAPETVAQGHHLDYTCSYRVTLTGEQIAPAAVHLAWTVDAAVAGGWRVQLRPPVTDPHNPPPWTDDPRPAATMTYAGAIAADAAPDIAETLETTAKLTFKLRVYRVACGAVEQPVTLNVAVAASLPGSNGATVQAGAPAPQPLTLTPALAPIPEPSVTFSGSLDFGEVAVDATGVKTPPKPQTITVKVSGLDQACGSWQLGLTATPLDGAHNATIDASNLQLSSIDDHPVADGDCALDGGCPIAVVPAGPTAEPTATFNLGVSLVLPDQPRATTFNATLTASLTEAHS